VFFSIERWTDCCWNPLLSTCAFFSDTTHKMNTRITSEHKPSGVHLTVCGHEWEACVPDPPGEWCAAKLPPPFDSWGPQTAWKLKSCGATHEGTCAEYTIRSCTESETRRSRLLQNFNLVFGVTRNKAFASAFRAKKQAEADAAEEEEDDEVEEADDDPDDDDASSSSSDSDSLVVEDEDANEAEEDEDEDEEAADKEDSVSVSSSSSSSSSEAPRKAPAKRGKKRAAPTKDLK